ncbi:MAG: hypothetical protein HOK57_02835 [Planctomycetaceae bacterium]|jgi:hypothetical protein|nr:hypothetical protein [Planctomycetaceae bacterium]MBT6054514.1 hypothetical protein [Planctomycetaceae bacterium]MBT6458739.1 hypothetical protein [Planctomycetaceae bacterium]MBT6642456.1 hypothetical protein [Planctomycetaceae bacterium]MBT6920076.1 hypothetical protein [Planctomycetaceae bacterium]
MPTSCKSLRKSLVVGLIVLTLGQIITAGTILLRSAPSLSLEYRSAAVGIVSVISLSGGCFAWYITCWSKKMASTQPALGIAAALAANFTRLALPLFVLAFLQISTGKGLFGVALKNFIEETLVASYLVLLLLDILLHMAGYGMDIHNPHSLDDHAAETQNTLLS